MNIKYIQTSTIVFLFGLSILMYISPAQAAPPLRGVLREEVKESVQNIKKEVREESKNLLDKAKSMVREKIKRHIKGKITAINGTSSLIVSTDKGALTVLLTDKTQLKRRFGGTSVLSEFSVNDEVIIIGSRKKNSDESLSDTEIEATYIRNMSIQRRFAVFAGEVLSKSSENLILKTEKRGNQTVYISSKTEYKQRNSSITFVDIQVGNKLIVKGELWNRAGDKIDAKTILKLAVTIKSTQAVQPKD